MDTLQIDASLTQGDFRLAVRETLELAGITAVFGASGSGKTTLLRVIAGLEPEARGSIHFRGAAWLDGKRSLPPEARALGVVFQDGRLFPHLDVSGNLMFPIRHGRRRSAIGFDDTVQALGLETLLQRQTPSLSGGERQRVAIGRALLSGAGLLLMDEPLSSLDRDRKREILPLIRSLPKRFGLPILYVTHDVDELIYLASQLCGPASRADQSPCGSRDTVRLSRRPA
jgi:molybdate transport system ATP-binding protein